MTIPPGVGASLIYTNHRGETGPRQVVITGRVVAGPTEWHPAALWTFEVWDRKQGALRMFDPTGVLGEPIQLMERIARAAEMRFAAVTEQLTVSRALVASHERERRAVNDEMARLRQRAWDLDAALKVARGALRGALAAVPALEARRDELLATTNRYLERARRLRAALFRYRVHVIACEGTDYLDGAVGDDATEGALVSAIETVEPY